MESSSLGKNHRRLNPDQARGCEICGKQFRSKRLLLRHLESSYDLDKEVILCFLGSSESSKADSAEDDVESCERTPAGDGYHHQCIHCGKQLKNDRGLKQHLGKMHSTDLKCFGCSKCGKKFKDKYAVRLHINQVHKKTTKVLCPTCGKELYSKYILKKHTQKHHKVEQSSPALASLTND